MKLPKSIIKKYGISKKAWSVFRGKKQSREVPMARKRRGFGRFVKRTRRFGRTNARRAGIGVQGSLIQLDSFGYGVIRPKMESFVAPLVQKLPFGSANEEVSIAVALWLGAKYLPSGMIRNIAHKGLAIENYRAGEITSAKMFGQGTSNGNSNIQVFG